MQIEAKVTLRRNTITVYDYNSACAMMVSRSPDHIFSSYYKPDKHRDADYNMSFILHCMKSVSYNTDAMVFLIKQLNECKS